jgi:hypothetical protein
MNSDNLVYVTITNWDKYNPRTDRQNFTWFKLSNTFFYDHKLYILTVFERLVYIFLLCECSRNGGKPVVINIKMHSLLTGLSKEDIYKCFNRLEDIGIIKTSLRNHPQPNDAVTSEHGVIQTPRIEENRRDIHTCVQNGTEDNSAQPLVSLVTNFDFEELYFEYPRKIGKTRGFAKCKKTVRSELDYQLLKKAILNYKNYVGANRIGQEYVKHFSTFMGEWRDWVDYQSEEVRLEKTATNWANVD